MNYILSILFFVLSIFIGVCYSNKYSERKIFVSDICYFNKKVLNSIGFTNKTLVKIIKENSDLTNIDFIENRIKYKNTAYPKYISKSEKEFFETYFNLLGTSNLDSQIKLLGKSADRFDEMLIEFTSEERKYKDLSIKISVLIGLILFIIFI